MSAASTEPSPGKHRINVPLVVRWEKGDASGGGISTRLEDEDVDNAACKGNMTFSMSILRTVMHNFY
jgi:hypothetical protein